MNYFLLCFQAHISLLVIHHPIEDLAVLKNFIFWQLSLSFLHTFRVVPRLLMNAKLLDNLGNEMDCTKEARSSALSNFVSPKSPTAGKRIRLRNKLVYYRTF